MTTLVTLDELRNIYYQQQNNFSLSISSGQENIFTCSNITRCLPGKRISCQGTWQGHTVFAKLFIAPKRAKTHWQRELSGIELLSNRKICSPKLLHSGSTLNNKVYYIFFEFINNSAPLQTIWDTSSAAKQNDLLHKLVGTIAEHHNKGVLQKDLHLNNFLLANQKIYTLDGSDIIAFDKTDDNIACKNLAQLFAQLHPVHDQHISPALDSYSHYRQWNSDPLCLNKLLTETQKQRGKRKHDFIAKTQRECSLFCVNQTWSQLTIYARKYHSNDISQLIASPDFLIEAGQILKRGNSTTVSIVTAGNKQWLVKRYNTKNWIYLLSRAFRCSKALISWKNTNLLKFYGIPTPEPVAIIEKRFGPFRKTTYFISEVVLGENYWDYIHPSQLSDKEKLLLAHSVCTLLRSLKPLMISHGDLKASNIMIENNKASLIDLDAMQQHSNQNSFQKAYKKDMKRFLKNWENEPENQSFFKEHCINNDGKNKNSVSFTR
jgi:tRNA A-37 threonylcarbamoyl transferase component Bud32